MTHITPLLCRAHLRTLFCTLFVVFFLSLQNTAHAQRDTLILCDNRFDTLRQPSLPIIEAVLHKMGRRRSGSGSTWLISIKECRFGNIGNRTGQGKEAKLLEDGDPVIRNCLFFSADAWLDIGNRQFKKYCTMKRTLASPIENYVYDHHNQTLTKALRQLVDSIYRKPPESPAINDSVWSEEQVRTDNVTKGWADYPINRIALPSSNSASSPDSTSLSDGAASLYVESSINGASSSDGTFSTFGDFEYNRLYPHHFSMLADRDGICTFHWRDSFPAKTTPPPVWGVLYGGKYYIKITETQFLPLERNNNTFYFYIPYSLPNMYEMSFYAPPPGYYNRESSGFDAPAVDSWAGFIVVMTFGIVGEIIKSSRKPPPAPVKAIFPDERNDLRHCFLDMESGDIIFAKSPLCRL